MAEATPVCFMPSKNSCLSANIEYIFECISLIFRQEFIQNKCGIEIKSGYDLTDGRIRFTLPPGEPKMVSISIVNTSNEPVTFVQYKSLRRMRVFSLQDEQCVSASNTKILNPGEHVYLENIYLTIQ